METKKKMAGKAYHAPVMESVDVDLQALICQSEVNGCGGAQVGYGGGDNLCTNNNGPRSREDSSWDED